MGTSSATSVACMTVREALPRSLETLVARSQYVQETLLPPEVVEATLRLGVIGASDHVQVQCEVRNPVDGELLALWSIPHRPYEALSDVLALAIAELEAAVRGLISPF